MGTAYCAEHSAALEESMLGSVATKRVYLLVQHHGTWGAKAFPESDLPESVKAHLLSVAEAHCQPDEKPQNAVMLIRSNDRRDVRRKRVFVASADPARPLLRGFTFEDPEEILRLPLAETLAGEDHGEAIDNLLLVCTNGSRDLCCAKFGMPVFRRLNDLAPDLSFRCTHLGGHRFAATMLSLPSGYVYGRVTPEAAKFVLADSNAGLVSVDYLRGRSGWPKAAQVAEGLWRQASGVTEMDALMFLGVDEADAACTTVRFARLPEGDTVTVRFATETAAGSVIPSCGEAASEPVYRHRLLGA